MRRHLIYLMIILCMSFSACGSNPNKNQPAAVAEQGEISQTDSKLVNDSLPVIIDFSATWCGPCRKFAPIFHELKEEFSKDINFVTVDIDQYPELANKFGIEAVPTIVFLNSDKKEVHRITGAPDKQTMLQYITSLKYSR